jgi:hypothetical protein
MQCGHRGIDAGLFLPGVGIDDSLVAADAEAKRRPAVEGIEPDLARSLGNVERRKRFGGREADAQSIQRRSMFQPVLGADTGKIPIHHHHA